MSPTETSEVSRGSANAGQAKAPEADRHDLRMPVLALAAWAGGLAGLLAPVWLPWLVAAAAALAALRWRRTAAARLLGAAAVVLLAVGLTAQLRAAQVHSGPVPALATERAVAGLEVVLTSDPRLHQGRHGPFVTVRASTRAVTARGRSWQTRRPVLVIGSVDWERVRLGSRVRLTGRLEPDAGELAAVVSAAGPPRRTGAPSALLDGAERVRASIRAAVADRPPEQRALVPALVMGDDQRLGEDLADDFRTTGLTHLLAVSGTNLTLVVGFCLVIARWCGVRGRWLLLVGAIGIVGFVLLARNEPSVVRAAAMGTVALIGLGRHGRERGSRALAVAVVALLLLDPWLATSVGFTLSALATAGILYLGPPLRDAMTWLPRWAAEAIAVPLAAQLACTPVIAAISSQVSLVAVAANLLVVPAVAPATVLGLLAGLVGLLWPAAGALLGTLAGWCVAWIVTVARACAGLPGAAIGWGSGSVAVAVLTLVVVGVVAAAPRLLRRRTLGIGLALGLVVTILVPLDVLVVVFGRPWLPSLLPGASPWRPVPDDWALVACDVGQGDALVLRSGPHQAVVVDAGPDPDAVDRCLDRLSIRRVPLLVLTHFHADHIDGLPGVLRGRTVERIETTTLAAPPGLLAGLGHGARAPSPQPIEVDVGRRFGDVTVQALWPAPGVIPDSANDSSVVLLAQVGSIRVLLPGDLEPPAQAQLDRRYPDLAVDVLKVPHHGSRFQDTDWLVGLGARTALVCVGRGNDYGHPAPELLDRLTGAGLEVGRTDTDHDLVVDRTGALVR